MTGQWPYLNTEQNHSGQPHNSPATDAWISFPERYAFALAGEWYQPANLTYDSEDAVNVLQVLDGAAFARNFVQSPNLVDPTPASPQGSAIWAFITKQLRAVQNSLPGVP